MEIQIFFNMVQVILAQYPNSSSTILTVINQDLTPKTVPTRRTLPRKRYHDYCGISHVK